MIPARRAHPPIASPNGRRSGLAEPPDRSKAAAETQLSSEAAERTLSYRPREAADRGGRFLHEKKMPAPLNSRRGRRRRRSGQTWTRGQAEEKAGVWGGAGSGELAGLLPREARAVCESAAAGCPPGTHKGILSACRPLPSLEKTPVQKGPWQRPVPGRGPPVGSGVDSRLHPAPPRPAFCQARSFSLILLRISAEQA